MCHDATVLTLFFSWLRINKHLSHLLWLLHNLVIIRLEIVPNSLSPGFNLLVALIQSVLLHHVQLFQLHQTHHVCYRYLVTHNELFILQKVVRNMCYCAFNL